MDKWLPVWLVARRELRDQCRDWRILFPLSALTLFFPFLMLMATVLAVDYVNRYGANLVAERIIPFFLLVVGFFPVTITLAVSLETFVGEKERGTIEPLLSSPLYDWQLYFGKLLAGLFLPLTAILIDVLLYVVLLTWQGVKTPGTSMLVLTAVLSAMQAVLMVSGAIVISTQATSVRGANLLVSFIIIPVGLLLQGESMMMFWGNDLTLWLTVAAVAIMTGLIMRLGLAHFQREYLLGREIDILNLKWMWSTFWGAFRGQANSLGEWYRREIPKTLRKLKISLVVIITIGLLASVSAYLWMQSQPLASSVKTQDITSIFQSVFSLPNGQMDITFQFILWNNLRAILVISVLGVFSFGVLGTIAYLINVALIGGVLSAMSLVGYSPVLVFVSGILPHGIFEIPALILASATVLYFGAALVKPTPERTLGEVVIEALADWAKMTIGIVVPLLIAAAVIEAWITPRILMMVLAG